jgi:glycosyltransferase involved in cell wall biosynthesis
MRKIIVLTPVKNEAWILRQFIEATLQFADAIIIADQQSTDGSREIAEQYEQVIVIDNLSNDFNEKERQLLLIGYARKTYGTNTILFALDADEIISYDSIASTDYALIMSANPGTALLFEKPDVLPLGQKVIRWRTNYFQLGFIDDGRMHNPKSIHSTRLPNRDDSDKIFFKNIKFLHFAHLRPNVTSSKTRYYSVQENLLNSKPFYVRRNTYPSFYTLNQYYDSSEAEYLPDEWLKGWKEIGIHFEGIEDPIFNWQDLEVLRCFHKYGSSKFFIDNIWGFRWEDALIYFHQQGKINLPEKIIRPPFILILLLKLIDFLYKGYKNFRRFTTMPIKRWFFQ